MESKAPAGGSRAGATSFDSQQVAGRGVNKPTLKEQKAKLFDTVLAGITFRANALGMRLTESYLSYCAGMIVERAEMACRGERCDFDLMGTPRMLMTARCWRSVNEFLTTNGAQEVDVSSFAPVDLLVCDLEAGQLTETLNRPGGPEELAKRLRSAQTASSQDLNLKGFDAETDSDAVYRLGPVAWQALLADNDSVVFPPFSRPNDEWATHTINRLVEATAPQVKEVSISAGDQPTDGVLTVDLTRLNTPSPVIRIRVKETIGADELVVKAPLGVRVKVEREFDDSRDQGPYKPIGKMSVIRQGQSHPETLAFEPPRPVDSKQGASADPLETHLQSTGLGAWASNLKKQCAAPGDTLTLRDMVDEQPGSIATRSGPEAVASLDEETWAAIADGRNRVVLPLFPYSENPNDLGSGPDHNGLTAAHVINTIGRATRGSVAEVCISGGARASDSGQMTVDLSNVVPPEDGAPSVGKITIRIKNMIGTSTVQVLAPRGVEVKPVRDEDTERVAKNANNVAIEPGRMFVVRVPPRPGDQPELLQFDTPGVTGPEQYRAMMATASASAVGPLEYVNVKPSEVVGPAEYQRMNPTEEAVPPEQRKS
jgi:hypothetical protein